MTAPPQDAQITAVPFAPAPLYAVLPEDHPAAHKENLLLEDLAKDEWILFPKRFDPVVFDAIMDAAHSGSIVPKYAHDVIAPQQAVELVSEHLGVAILTQPSTTDFHADGVVVKPLSDASLCFNTCVNLRADNTSRLIEEYVVCSSADIRPIACHPSRWNCRRPTESWTGKCQSLRRAIEAQHRRNRCA